MQIRIDANGKVDGVVLTVNTSFARLAALPNHRIIDLGLDAIPSKPYTYSVPVTKNVNGQVLYNYIQQVDANGNAVLDVKGNPVKVVETQQIVQTVTLLDNMSLFTIDDVVREKYRLMTQQNFLENFSYAQFYMNPSMGIFESDVIPTGKTELYNVLVYAVGNYGTIQVSNDGGNTFSTVKPDVSFTFPMGGTGLLRVKFDNAPLEYAIMY